VRQRTGGGQRNWHRLVPACSGAKASLACEDRWLVGCARASKSVAEVGERRRGSKKRASRWLRGAWTGTQLSRSPQGVSGGFKGVDNRHRGGQAAEPGKARAGRLRGRCGAMVLRQTEGIPGRSSARSFTRTGRRRSRRPSRISRTRERQGKRGGGDRDVRGSVGTHRNGKKTPATMTVRKRTRATRQSELHCRRNRQSSFPCLRETRKRCDAAGTDEARVLVRRRENGRSRSDASRVTVIGESQGKSKIGALAEEDTAVSADARGGDSEAKTVRESRVAFYHGSKRDEETSASWWIATRRKASRSLHCRTARHGRMAV